MPEYADFPLLGRKGGETPSEVAARGVAATPDAATDPSTEEDPSDDPFTPEPDDLDTRESLNDFFGFDPDQDADEAQVRTSAHDDEIGDILGQGNPSDSTPDQEDEQDDEPGEGDDGDDQDDADQDDKGTDPEAPFGRDEEGRPYNEHGVPLNQYGLPHITDEEWEEYLAEGGGAAQREYINYQVEMERRKLAYGVQLQEARKNEIAQTRPYFRERFADADGAREHIHGQAEKVLQLLPDDQRNNPGFFEWACRLLVADQLPTLLKQFGYAESEAGDGEPDAEGAPGATGADALADFGREVAPTQPKPQSRSGRRVVQVEGGSVPAPSRTPDNRSHGLTADEMAFARSVGMTAKEYAANK